MDMVKMGSFLAELRKEQKLTQAELGEKLGVTNKTVSRWETGTYMPPVEILEELSRLYGLTINEILSGRKLTTEEYKEMAESNITAIILHIIISSLFIPVFFHPNLQNIDHFSFHHFYGVILRKKSSKLLRFECNP